MSQDKKGIIKTDVGFLADYNFYQLIYEFNIEDKKSFEVGLGFGSESGVNVYGLSLQARYYFFNKAPRGFHIGPRVLAIYAETNESNYLGVKDNSFGFELDGILGYQFLLGDVVTLDPYIAPGLAIVNNQTNLGFVYGLTVGIAF